MRIEQPDSWVSSGDESSSASLPGYESDNLLDLSDSDLGSHVDRDTLSMPSSPEQLSLVGQHDESVVEAGTSSLQLMVPTMHNETDLDLALSDSDDFLMVDASDACTVDKPEQITSAAGSNEHAPVEETVAAVRAHADQQADEVHQKVVMVEPQSIRSYVEQTTPLVFTTGTDDARASRHSAINTVISASSSTIRIVVAGRQLQDDEYITICDTIKANLLNHHTSPHSNTTARTVQPEFAWQHFRTTDNKHEQLAERPHLYVYALSTTTELEEKDANVLLQMSEAAPLLVVVSVIDFLNPISLVEARNKIGSFLHQNLVRRNVLDHEQQVETIMRSCILLQHLSSIDISSFIKRRIILFTSSVHHQSLSFVYPSQFWGTTYLTHIRAVMGALFATLVLSLGAFFCMNAIQDSLPSRPCHASVGSVLCAPNDYTCAVTINAFTSKGLPYTSDERYTRGPVFHARVLHDQALALSWSAHMNPSSKDLLDVSEPVVHDLRNGTYRVVVNTFHRGQRRNAGLGSYSQKRLWFRPDQSRLFLHLWFDNGTCVPGMPQELVWAKKPPVSVSPCRDLIKPINLGLVATKSQRYRPSTIKSPLPSVRGLHQLTMVVFSQMDPVLNVAVQVVEFALNTLKAASGVIDRLTRVENYVHNTSTALAQRFYGAVSTFLSHVDSAISEKLCSWKHEQSADTMGKPRSTTRSASEPKDLVVLFDRQIQSLSKHLRMPVTAIVQHHQHLPPRKELSLNSADRPLRPKCAKNIFKEKEWLQAQEPLRHADAMLSKIKGKPRKAMKQSKATESVNNKWQRKVEKLKATRQGRRWLPRMEQMQDKSGRRCKKAQK
ncbi:hypothetical protein EDD11_005011 [Mortierella claussenii]|nr:hypothetical protein EDD11_005011 [Mortierella claussenii]